MSRYVSHAHCYTRLFFSFFLLFVFFFILLPIRSKTSPLPSSLSTSVHRCHCCWEKTVWSAWATAIDKGSILRFHFRVSRKPRGFTLSRWVCVAARAHIGLSEFHGGGLFICFEKMSWFEINRGRPFFMLSDQWHCNLVFMENRGYFPNYFAKPRGKAFLYAL